MPRAATVLSMPTPRTLQARRRIRLRKLPPDHDAACGRHLDPTTACGDGRWTTALDCAGQETVSEGPSLHAPCCRSETWVKVPLLVRVSRAPLASIVIGSSTGGLDAPTVLMNRPRPAFLRRPAKGNALPKAGVPSAVWNPMG